MAKALKLIRLRKCIIYRRMFFFSPRITDDFGIKTTRNTLVEVRTRKG